MCGIIGYIGQKNILNVIVSALHRLEYRGYDSAGLAFINQQGSLSAIKTTGKISNLELCLKQNTTDIPQENPSLGIGHTRWATHGEPTQANAHPHLSQDKRFAVVHNGIIDNYTAIKDRLIKKGYKFLSDTDTEVIAHLIQECYEGDLRAAVAASVEQLTGTYGIAVISSEHPDTIIAARKGSPIVAGICQNETIIASDVSAIINHTKQVVFLNDGDILTATPEGLDITSVGNIPVTRELTHINWDMNQIEKEGYDHFMLKEIHEQPSSLQNTLRGRLLPDEGSTKLSGTRLTHEEMTGIDRVIIAACGTSYYAGMVGKYLFEDIAGIPTDIQQAAEFRYRNPIIEKNTCMLAISQSGETADTLAAVKEGMSKKATVLSICNVVGSSIARETNRGVYLHAGPEISVASTKAFSCQVAVLAMLAIAFGRTRRLSPDAGRRMVAELATLPEIAEKVIAQSDNIKAIAEKYAKAGNFFYIGRGYMFPAALEGALKLKEISYIHAEGYHAAELKHGPIALLDSSLPVIAAAADVSSKDKTLANIKECKARKAPVIAITTEGDTSISRHCDDTIFVPECPDFLSPIPVVIAEQLFAYYTAKWRGCPIDQPRNLAKSVTVE